MVVDGALGPVEGAERQADAQLEMARFAGQALGLQLPGAEPPRAVIHTTVEQLAAHTGACPSPHAGEDSAEQRAGDGVGVGTLEEEVPAGPARHPGPSRCEQTGPISVSALQRHACDAHHVVRWSRGGETVLVDVVLMCGRHHTEIHREQWTITVLAGVPWSTPPRWPDPERTPLRNTSHVAIVRTRRAGARLAAGQPPADDDRPP